MQLAAAKPDLAAALAADPGAVVETVAREHGVTTREVEELESSKLMRICLLRLLRLLNLLLLLLLLLSEPATLLLHPSQRGRLWTTTVRVATSLCLDLWPRTRAKRKNGDERLGIRD